MTNLEKTSDHNSLDYNGRRVIPRHPNVAERAKKSREASQKKRDKERKVLSKKLSKKTESGFEDARRGGYIQIRDAKGGYRVRLVGANHEVLQTSEVIESRANVIKHITAIHKIFSNLISWVRNIHDATKDQAFKAAIKKRQ